jgi:hypothetical protein
MNEKFHWFLVILFTNGMAGGSYCMKVKDDPAGSD